MSSILYFPDDMSLTPEEQEKVRKTLASFEGEEVLLCVFKVEERLCFVKLEKSETPTEPRFPFRKAFLRRMQEILDMVIKLSSVLNFAENIQMEAHLLKKEDEKPIIGTVFCFLKAQSSAAAILLLPLFMDWLKAEICKILQSFASRD